MWQPNSSERPAEAGSGEVRDERLRPSAPAVALDPAWRAGRKLAEARAQLGLSLDEVADRIRVRKEFLEALEQQNVKLLPGKAYALAFLRSYARALGIDDKAIVDQYQGEVALSRNDNEKPIRNPTSRPRRDRPWIWAAAVVVLAVAFVGWRALSQQQPVVEPAHEQATLSPQTGSGGAATPGAARRVVEIRAITEAWIEARGPDGTVFLSRTLHAGDVYRPDASPGWTLHARDGASFELFVNGAPAGPLGPAGMPVLGRAVDDIRPLTQAELAAPRS